MHNLKNRVMLMLAPEGTASGSAEGAPAPGNAEDSLLNAFGNAESNAGANGGEPAAKPDTGEPAAGGTQTESEIKLAAWADQLPPEMRGNPQAAAKLAKFQKIGDMAKAFLELEGKAEAGGIPAKDAAPEEVAAFWEKAGRPKQADGYSFAADKEQDGAAFADVAYKANLTAAQAEAVFNSLNRLGASRLQDAAFAQQQQVKETAAALAAEYGSKYVEKMELLARGMEAAGPNVAKLLKQAGLTGNPEIIKAFISYGEMTAESGAARGGGAGEALKSVEEGATFEFKT